MHLREMLSLLRAKQEQVFILNTHLEAQGEQPVFQLDNLMQQVYVTFTLSM